MNRKYGKLDDFLFLSKLLCLDKKFMPFKQTFSSRIKFHLKLWNRLNLSTNENVVNICDIFL
jgi:3-phenylpropionate/cinnamic acid dioxygenase small subunit